MYLSKEHNQNGYSKYTCYTMICKTPYIEVAEQRSMVSLYKFQFELGLAMVNFLVLFFFGGEGSSC